MNHNWRRNIGTDRARSDGADRGFSLVELLVSIGVLSLMLALLAEMTNQTRKVASQVHKRVETFRETRIAFEAMARRISQATLNNYWGYDNPDKPSHWMRQSELHFTNVQSDSALTTAERPTTGHGVFFQAPFGYAGSEASSTGDARLDYLDDLLNGWGYYVEFNSDLEGRTPFLKGETVSFPERKRFRLMELRIPSEELSVMKPPPSDPDGLPSISKEGSEAGINQWFASPDIRARFARPVAENVLALLISPRAPDGVTLEGDESIAPEYTYDSRLFQYKNGSSRSRILRHQLPEMLDLTLIATDEGSWLAYEQKEGLEASELLLKEINSRFQEVKKYKEDLNELKTWMLDMNLEPRIFRLSVRLRTAKFSTNLDV